MGEKNLPRKSEPGRKRVMIICEGFEDADYIRRLTECNVWSKNIVLKVCNAKGINRIVEKYEVYLRSGDYEKIVVFCDTEETPHTQFESVKRDIELFSKNVTKSRVVSLDEIVFYANPCTMQVIIMHFGYEILKTKDKATNSSIIKKYVPIDGVYSAEVSQRKAIMDRIDKTNYSDSMKKNINRFVKEKKSADDYSTNILELFDSLENGWV